MASSVGLTTIPKSSDGSPEGQDAEVTLEDQRKINRFARLNGKEEELDVVLKSLKRQLQNIEEANSELILADDGLEDDLDDDPTASDVGARDLSNIHFRIGESFIAVNKDDAEKLLEERRKELDREIKDFEERITPMKEEMLNIKANLYAKFGNNINLDQDEDAA